jgi:hypothetical protein
MLVPHNSEAHPDTWALVNPQLDVMHWDSEVPPDRVGRVRTTVLIHPANYVTELRGCLAPGTRAQLGASWSVQNSRAAFQRIHDLIARLTSTQLTIVEAINS